MTEIPNRIMFSEMHKIASIDDKQSAKVLHDLMMKVFAEGLEGLVMKDIHVSLLRIYKFCLVLHVRYPFNCGLR